MNTEPRTLTQRTIAARLRIEIDGGRFKPLAGVAREAADELDRLTRPITIEGQPATDLYEQLLELDDPLGRQAADEIARLRQIIRSVFFDCESQTIPGYRGTRVIIGDRLFDAIRTEARRP